MGTRCLPGGLSPAVDRNDPDHSRCAALLESRTDDLLATPYCGDRAGLKVPCLAAGMIAGADSMDGIEVRRVKDLNRELAGDLGIHSESPARVLGGQ
jgi:hypothetical protein